MPMPISRLAAILFGAALFLAACESFNALTSGPGIQSLLNNSRGRMLMIHFPRMHSTKAWRKYRGIKRLISFPTQIQHVVVIVMENRTVDNLFSAYYSSNFCGTNHSTNCATALDLYNPAATPTLYPNYLKAQFDPDHKHVIAWQKEIAGNYQIPHKCFGRCPQHDTSLSYVPSSDTGIYAQLIQNWAFANNVLQANEGPSYEAHQYFIAGQSGGLPGAATSPDAEAENPQTTTNGAPTPYPTGDYTASPDDPGDLMSSPGCDPTSRDIISTIDMSIPAPSPTNTLLGLDNGTPTSPPCEEYGTSPSYQTILDEISKTFGTPPIFDWQYVAHDSKSLWAAPLGVKHLYQGWITDPANYPFFVDPNAEKFVYDIEGQNASPRPFAALTFLTPCGPESDHPEPSSKGEADGPEWLAWVVNAIGQSQYWSSTAIVVVWDDWGGWFDHEPLSNPNNPNGLPVRPSPNNYHNSADPNEWGFRVPLMVISPYITARGYVSTHGATVPLWRSQSVILQFIEAIFGVPGLGADDGQNSPNDALVDVFNPPVNATPLPYVAITEPPDWATPAPTETCQSGFSGGGPSYRRHRGHKHPKAMGGPALQPRPTLRPPNQMRLDIR